MLEPIITSIKKVSLPVGICVLLLATFISMPADGSLFSDDYFYNLVFAIIGLSIAIIAFILPFVRLDSLTPSAIRDQLVGEPRKRKRYAFYCIALGSILVLVMAAVATGHLPLVDKNTGLPVSAKELLRPVLIFGGAGSLLLGAGIALLRWNPG